MKTMIATLATAAALAIPTLGAAGPVDPRYEAEAGLSADALILSSKSAHGGRATVVNDPRYAAETGQATATAVIVSS